jgi:DNA uptake protein ComE-like DNA-binding protein
MCSQSVLAVWLSVLTAAAIPASISASAAIAAERPNELVDINQATVVELLKVPGMTPGWAGRIVRFRPYRTKLDLLDQGVVTSEVYQRIRDGVIAHRAAPNDTKTRKGH